MGDAVVVGAGPNGLAAAIGLAAAGHSVQVVEGAPTIGGGTRSAELTLPGFVHDVCSAIHPLGIASPVFQQCNLGQHGLEWVSSPAEVAHPFDDGSAALLWKSFDETGKTLGPDAVAWRSLLEPISRQADELVNALAEPGSLVRHPRLATTFGMLALRSARSIIERRFSGTAARGLFAGIAAHSFLPLESASSAAMGLVLGALGHAQGWPFPRGGSQQIADALAAHLRSLGGEITTGTYVESVNEFPGADAILLDVTPRQLLDLAGDHLPDGYRRRLGRFRYGPGVHKMDFALDGPIPWTAPECALAATVHLGGTFEEIARSEASTNAGIHPDKPFILLAQQSLFDDSRAPAGKHTAWAYCHVPHGSTVDMSERIEAQIERFAPGFRDRILARSVMAPAALEAYNPNLVGGDISGGYLDLRQLFTRPVVRFPPWTTPDKRIYLCSSSTPPGGGVHGIPGHHAAQAALRRAW